jgi:hypothetical protein
MATQIQIKRGAATSETAPSSNLAAGEMAVTYGDTAGQANGGDKLYIGNAAGSGNLIIGGKYFADLIDHTHGTLTASSGLIVDSNSKLDNLKVDNIDLNGSAITTTNTNGDLDITPHGTGIVNFKGDGSSADGAIKIFCSQNTHGITIKSPAHSAAATYTLTLPVDDGTANQALMTNGSGVLAWGGALSGTTGTFSGAVSGTTGTFSAAVSGTTGTFTSTVVGVAGTFSGAVSGTTGTFSGDISSTGSTAGNVRVGITADNEIDTSSGSLTIDSAGGTVTIDNNLTISASKTIDMGANKVTNIADPTGAQDAASKAYVDAVKTGLDIKDSCDVATTADVSTWTYSNGTAGVGATLTAAGNGVVAIDSVNLTLNMRVLVKDQSPSTENGIYYVSTAGAAGAILVLTRALDANQPAELTGGSFTFVEQGTTQAENGYVFTHNGEPTFGTGNTALTVAQFSGAGQIIAGTSLTKSGNTMNVATDGTTMFTLSDALSVKSTGTAGQVLRSTGTAGQAAVYGQLDLANSAAVTGIAAVPNGGTGVNTIGANLLMTGDGTNAVNTIAVGTSGQVLLSAGSGTDPSFGHVDGGTF